MFKETPPVLRYLIYFLFGFIWMNLISYLPAEIYHFPTIRPFNGDSLVNPYKNCDFNQRYIANFHAHTKSWLGITNGSASAKEVHQIYRQLGYDVIGISNYMTVSDDMKDSSGYIPVYEHGINLKKTHQLVINANRVSWHDQFLYQTIHHKQSNINQLKQNGGLLVINHPRLNNGYTKKELNSLRNYDLIEVFNHGRRHDSSWDQALSAGHKIYCLANDDLHHIRTCDLARSLNLIYSASINHDSILYALENGHSVAVNLPHDINMKIEDKIKTIRSLPSIVKYESKNDSLFIDFGTMATQIVFIRQHNDTVTITKNNTRASCAINHDTHYLRVSAVFKDGTEYLLNPVFRFDKDNPLFSTTQTDLTSTWMMRLIILTILISPIFLFDKIKINTSIKAAKRVKVKQVVYNGI